MPRYIMFYSTHASTIVHDMSSIVANILLQLRQYGMVVAMSDNNQATVYSRACVDNHRCNEHTATHSHQTAKRACCSAHS